MLGENHPETAIAYNNLAMSLSDQDQHAEAEPAYRKALAIFQRVNGDNHPRTANCCNNLAVNLHAQRKDTEAGPLYRRALAIRLKLLGDEHQATAESYNNLGSFLSDEGKHAEAEPHLRRALAIKLVMGEEHQSTAMSYQNLAGNLFFQGRYAEAENLCRSAVANLETARLRVSSFGLERAASDRSRARVTWSAALLQTGRPAEAWQVLEGYFGRGLLDDLSARQMRSLTVEEQKELDGLNARLTGFDQQAARLLSGKGGLEANRERFELVARDRKAIASELARFAARLLEKDVYGLKRIQSHLSAGDALLAWVDIDGRPKAVRPNGEHWAFLLKATGEPIVVELRGTGQDGAWTKADDELPGRVRDALASRNQSPQRQRAPVDSLAHAAGSEALYRQRLAPLEEHLKGIRHLIVLPSAALAGIPLEAITDRYLISYAPSGTLLARLVEARLKDRGMPSKLLAVGDPVFGKAEDVPEDIVAAALRGPVLTPLPGTRREVEAIASLFPAAEKVLGADASRPRLAQLAETGRLRQFDVLHLATHGRTDPHVAFQSALLLSQAGDDNGRLTALEIREKWKLNAKLVVLSACESGLGKYAGGEGYLGFSQALFLAGARSIILSLWQVDDVATALLMVRFYENWLGRDSTGGSRPRLAKAEALREAKHWLRNLTREEAEKRIAGLPETARGLKLVSKAEGRDPKADKPFEHPFYWSAFILIGDPE